MKLNKKGFTLVELLAVIVVLALLMVVAASSIGSALENSKIKSLETEANKILTNAYTDLESSIMAGTTSSITSSPYFSGQDGDFKYGFKYSVTTGDISDACFKFDKFYVTGNVTDGKIEVDKAGETACSQLTVAAS